MPVHRFAVALSISLLLFYIWAAVLVVGQAQATSSQLGEAKTVVILGKRLTSLKADEDFMARIQRLDILLSDSTYLRAIATGASRGAKISEAAFVARALPHRRVELEESAQTTRDNLRYVKIMTGSELPVGIITNRYHLARTALLVQQKGMNVVLVPAEDRWVWTWSNAASVSREALLYWPCRWGW